MMLTKAKLDAMRSNAHTTEEKLIVLLYERFGGAAKLQDILDVYNAELGTMSKSTLTNVHCRKSPYLNYEGQYDMVSLARKGKPPEAIGVQSDIWQCESVAQFIATVLWQDPDMTFPESCERLLDWSNVTGISAGDYCGSKEKHYSYYRRLVKKWRKGRGME